MSSKQKCMRNKRSLLIFQRFMSAATGSARETPVLHQTAPSRRRSGTDANKPRAAATTNQKAGPRTKKVNQPRNFLLRLVWFVSEIDFDINFDHEQMGPPPSLRVSLRLPFPPLV